MSRKSGLSRLALGAAVIIPALTLAACGSPERVTRTTTVERTTDVAQPPPTVSSTTTTTTQQNP